MQHSGSRRGLRPLDVVKAPLWVASLATSNKSFADNPVLGSERLNRRGLHVARIKLAAKMAAIRRERLARQLDPADVETFNRDGMLVKRDLLPADAFKRLTDEIFSADFDAREQRQGQGRAVERRVTLGPETLARYPELAAFVSNKTVLGAIRYASSRGGRPIFYLQNIMSDPVRENADPQTAFHTDTFHATTKAWYFLHDVNEDEGPFSYVPGSHLPTPARLEWEYQQSLSAARNPNRHHAVGSFRVTLDEIAAMGYRPPVRVAVPGNTLVVADTFGFHARTPSDKPTTRIAIHAYMRRNPFLPWNGLDLMSLPGIKGRELDLYHAMSDFSRKLTGKGPVWRPVGDTKIDARPHV